MRKVKLLPTRDCEAGYGPGTHFKESFWQKKVPISFSEIFFAIQNFGKFCKNRTIFRDIFVANRTMCRDFL